MTAQGGEAVGKPGVAGVHTNQRLNLSKPWEGLQMIGQGFKPDSGNPTVRHYRGASGNVRHGETVNPSCNRKSRNGNPSPTARRARFLSRQANSSVSIAEGLLAGAHRLTCENQLSKHRYRRAQLTRQLLSCIRAKLCWVIGRTCARLDPTFPVKSAGASGLPDIVRKET